MVVCFCIKQGLPDNMTCIVGVVGILVGGVGILAPEPSPRHWHSSFLASWTKAFPHTHTPQDPTAARRHASLAHQGDLKYPYASGPPNY